MNIVPVILCGGSGTRLWPASREYFPKQFLNLMSDFSLLQETMNRSLRAGNIDPANLVVVTLSSLRKEVERQITAIHPGGTRHIISEPCAKNTAGAVALAAAYVLEKFGPDALMWVLPADHHIGDEEALNCAIGDGIKAARNGYMVTFGIQPTRPDTGYGYIRTGKTLIGESVLEVKQFVEKPNRETAQSYLDSGDYLWNSGMFLFTAQDVLSEFEQYAPDILSCVHEAIHEGMIAYPSAGIYKKMPEQPFDKAIMEKTSRLAVVPCNPAWSDVGSWESLWDIRPKDGNGNAITGRAECHETANCLIEGNGRLVACAGIEDLVIIDHEDVLLIADKKNSELIKTLVNSLKKSGSHEVFYPPGHRQAMSMTPMENGFVKSNGHYEIRQIKTLSRNTIFFEPHQMSSMSWKIVEGEGQLVVGTSKPKTIKAGMTVTIPPNSLYFLTMTGKKKMKIVEIAKSQDNDETIISLNFENQQKAA